MKYFRIPIPHSAAEEAGLNVETSTAGADNTGGLDALNNLLDGMNTEVDNSTPDAAQQQQTQTQTQTQTPEGSGDVNQNNRSNAQDKQNYAFGQMRTQINQLTGLLGKIASANGIEYTDSKELIAKLNDDSIAKMAQKQNVPVELLREVESLRKDSEAFKAQQLKDAASIGFQNLVNAYGLSQEQLQEFAVELDQQGKNPFTQPIDLMREYKITHFDDIIQQATEKAVQEALAKSGAADQHSSTPGQNQGSNSGSVDKISTVAGLTDLLNELK